MDVTLVIALIGAFTGAGSLCWQIWTKRQERAQVVVRSWWEHDDRLALVFVVEAHNTGTKDAAAIVAVGAEQFFPAGLEAADQTVVERTTVDERWCHWWLRDIDLIHQEGSLTGAAAEPVTLAAQHRVTYRFANALADRSTEPFFPIVELATGEVARGGEASPKPDPATIGSPWIGPTQFG